MRRHRRRHESFETTWVDDHLWWIVGLLYLLNALALLAFELWEEIVIHGEL